MAPIFDPTNPVQTRDGRKARIICTDAAGYGEPIIALVTDSDGDENTIRYGANGNFSPSGRTCEEDLINVSPGT